MTEMPSPMLLEPDLLAQLAEVSAAPEIGTATWIGRVARDAAERIKSDANHITAQEDIIRKMMGTVSAALQDLSTVTDSPAVWAALAPLGHLRIVVTRHALNSSDAENAR